MSYNSEWRKLIVGSGGGGVSSRAPCFSNCDRRSVAKRLDGAPVELCGVCLSLVRHLIPRPTLAAAPTICEVTPNHSGIGKGSGNTCEEKRPPNKAFCGPEVRPKS